MLSLASEEQSISSLSLESGWEWSETSVPLVSRRSGGGPRGWPPFQ